MQRSRRDGSGGGSADPETRTPGRRGSVGSVAAAGPAPAPHDGEAAEAAGAPPGPEGRPYRLSDALLGAVVGLALTLLPGYGLSSMTAETLTCERVVASAEPSCRLSRRIVGVTVRETFLGAVRDAGVEESPGSAWFSRSASRRSTPSFRVRYASDAGRIAGTSRPVREDHDALVEGLHRFLADPDRSAYSATVRASPMVWRVAVGGLFALGLLCLLNIPFAALAAMRRRSGDR